MNNVSEQGAIDDTRKAVVGLSVLMALTSAVLGFVTTGVVAIVWRSITATSLTFYGLAILWLVLGRTVLFATSRTLRRRIESGRICWPPFSSFSSWCCWRCPGTLPSCCNE